MYTLSLQEIVLWCCILVAAGIFFGMCIELKTHTGEHQRKVLQNEVEIGWRCTNTFLKRLLYNPDVVPPEIENLPKKMFKELL